jgi:hypothetical protein
MAHGVSRNPQQSRIAEPCAPQAVVTHEAGKTPSLALYGPGEAGDDAPLLWYFPSFYNWAHGKTEIPEHITQYETFVATYGTTLQLVEPAATA